MLLTRYGIREWMTMTVLAAAAGGGCAWMGWWWVVGVVGVVWLAGVAFFRDPIRRIPIDLPAGAMLSPADGTISAIERVDHHEATGGASVIVRIFLSVLNVHINRSPCAGEVVGVKYVPGKFLDARKAESAKVNEWNLVTLNPRMEGDSEGEKVGSAQPTVGIRQVSGAIARRIVCPLEIGDWLEQGQKYGMIKFGSTTELILPWPDQVEVKVKVGDKVRAGRTVLAVLGGDPGG